MCEVPTLDMKNTFLYEISFSQVFKCTNGIVLAHNRKLIQMNEWNGKKEKQQIEN